MLLSGGRILRVHQFTAVLILLLQGFSDEGREVALRRRTKGFVKLGDNFHYYPRRDERTNSSGNDVPPGLLFGPRFFRLV
jgi:hypothetical protein